MIVVRLNGGLGNQMFQYALGKHLSILRNAPLKLDVRWFKKGIREYELAYFTIEENIATEEEIKVITRMTTSFADRWQRNIMEPLLPYYKRSILEETCNFYDANVFKSKSNVYIKGYWQTEKYFAEIRDEIKKNFTYKYALDDENRKISELICSCNAVSVHIRRGDYISNPEYAAKYGSCDSSYYQRAQAFLSKKLTNPYYFIFSDDPEWTRKNITFFQPGSYIHHNQGKESHKDMLLTSLCKHNIIANSSFSWWGAWLNDNSEKIVIAPKKWFNNQSAANKDLVPNSWIQL